MALTDYQRDMLRCARCSECKWVPLAQVKSWRFANQCPSISKYNFHAYSISGRLIMGLSMLEGRTGYTDDTLDILYKDPMCGACNVSCKCTKDMEQFEVLYELRAKCVEDGKFLPAHIPIIKGLKQENNMMQLPKAGRGKWAEGLDVKDVSKEKAEVLFHAGCRYSFDKTLQPIARTAVKLFKNAGIDIGIGGKEEGCCGGRAYELGYRKEMDKRAEENIELVSKSGAKILVTPCAECYQAFKVLYHKIGKKLDLEILHTSEYVERLIRENKIKLTKKVPLAVTYHDPCHLGRMGEPYIPWKGVEKKVLNQVYIYDPPKPWRRGTHGVYDPPRDVLRNIPGLKLLEMERTREYAWCCGAGGGVKEGYPDFALWTAMERIEEAKATGAEAIVTACPWCERNFADALKQSGDRMKVYDIAELVEMSI